MRIADPFQIAIWRADNPDGANQDIPGPKFVRELCERVGSDFLDTALNWAHGGPRFIPRQFHDLVMRLRGRWDCGVMQRNFPSCKIARSGAAVSQSNRNGSGS